MERYRIATGVGVYYVTFTVIEWLPVFIDESACKIITESLNFCIENKFLMVNAYVIMPTHLHAILFDVDFNADRLKHSLDDMRKFTGRQLLDYSAKHSPESFSKVFRQRAGKDGERRFWQPTQHPVGIFSEQFWKQKMDYLHFNPGRERLVKKIKSDGSGSLYIGGIYEIDKNSGGSVPDTKTSYPTASARLLSNKHFDFFQHKLQIWGIC